MQENKTNKRMEWINLFEKNQSNDSGFYFVYYEVFSEAHIGGILKYGGKNLLCCPILDSNQGKKDLFCYLIKIKYPKNSDYSFNERSYSPDGYFFQKGLIGEFISIFSVFFQARFFVRSMVMGKLPDSIPIRVNYKVTYITPNKNSHPKVLAERLKRNWCKQDKLTSFLDSFSSINQEYHQDLITSLYWYSEGIKEIGINHERFYIKMVSCIETLSKTIKTDTDELEKKMKEIVKKDFQGEEKQEINNWLKNRKVKKKFVTFIKKYSISYFKEIEEDTNPCHIKEADLEKYLTRIYSARSKYLHEGRPMYISMDSPSIEDLWDIGPEGDIFIDRKRINEKNKLPCVRWFEEIVHCCLISFIEEKVTENKD